MKYGNKKTTLDGHIFDSKREAQRYAELKLYEKAGMIMSIQLQVPYVLIPKQHDENGKSVRECKYIADFVYIDKSVTPWKTVVEDVKGFRTKDYIIKKKLMLQVYGITVREV